MAELDEIETPDEVQRLIMENQAKQKVDKVPALFQHAENAFGIMFQLSSKRDNNTVVYTGFLGRVINRDLGLSSPMYSKVTLCLKGMGCIKQLKRGGGSSQSVWLLIKEPTLELYRAWEGTDEAIKVSRRPVTHVERTEASVAHVSADVADLTAKCDKMLDALQRLGDHLASLKSKNLTLEKRIEKLEEKVGTVHELDL